MTTTIPLRAAVTGVSGDVGLGTLKGLAALVPAPFVLGIDASVDNVGYHLTSAHAQLPLVKDPGYVDALIETLHAHQVQVLFPGIDSELVVLAQHRARIEAESGCRLALAPDALVFAAADKLLTAQLLRGHGLPAPPTWDLATLTDPERAALPFPLIAKPRMGQASKGVVLLADDDELGNFLLEPRPGYCLQEHIEGPELTVGLLFDADGVLVDHLAMERSLQGGRTMRARVVHEDAVDALVAAFAERVPSMGAVNLQLRLHPERGPQVFEINARLSGSTAMRVAVGFNDAARLLTHLATGAPMTRATVQDATVFRAWAEVVVLDPKSSDAPTHAILDDSIDTIVFDCGDTLLGLDPPRPVLFADAARSVGLNLSAELASGAIDRAYELVDFGLKMRSSELKGDDEKRAFYARFNRALCCALGIESHADVLHRALLATFRAQRRWRPLPGVVEMLEAVSARGPCHVLANWDAGLEALLTETSLRPFFTSVHASEHLGAEKPDPRAFAAFVERSGVVPARALYVGNEYTADIAGSRAAGFRPVLFDPHGRASESLDCARLTSWNELTDAARARAGRAP